MEGKKTGDEKTENGGGGKGQYLVFLTARQIVCERSSPSSKEKDASSSSPIAPAR